MTNDTILVLLADIGLYLLVFFSVDLEPNVIPFFFQLNRNLMVKLTTEIGTFGVFVKIFFHASYSDDQ